MDAAFRKELEDSLYVHFPLKPDDSRSRDVKDLEKAVVNTTSLWDGTSLTPWKFEGEGEYSVEPEGILRLHTWSRADHWPESEVRAKDAAQGAYATFGSYIAFLDLKGLDLSKGNRISFKVRPECEGGHTAMLRLGIVNDGKVKIPDTYAREGFYAMDLRNHEWNDCVWEIDSIAHDRLTELSFNIHRYGKDVSTGDNMEFFLKDIRFDQVEANVVHGWQCARDRIAYSTTGYFADGEKTAIVSAEALESAKTFELCSVENGICIYRGKVQKFINEHGTFGVLDFSEVTKEGAYRICMGDLQTETFRIGNDVVESTLWKLLNFLYCERCGFPVPNCHGTCHGDVLAEHKGEKLAFTGGWHDAADVSQQTVQSAEVADGLLAVADRLMETQTLETGHLLYLRLVEEASWGMDFILRMRFGDGYRAANTAIRRWTDGRIGNMDDERVDVNNRSMENFLFAAIEAHGGTTFRERDPELAWKCLETAKEDYQFAKERFEKVGVEPPHMEEHTSNAGLSQYYAAAALAAARIYQADPKERYAKDAAFYADKVLECQETGEKVPLAGFFYRDEEKKHIVHFSHQARDQIFVMALEAVCRVLPEHPRKPEWEASMKLYGEYLKKLNQYGTPYGMIPAGIYHISEAEDKEVFEVVHPHADFEVRKEDYKEQLQQGISLGGGYFIRMFPVWFSFRGNSAIHLSMGKAASILGMYLKDQELTEIARGQLYWTLGKNPFTESLIYGEGNFYGRQYTALLGETTGAMPVGVQTRGNEDLPYFPPAAVATYREVWTTPPGRWMWIAADLIK